MLKVERYIYACVESWSKNCLTEGIQACASLSPADAAVPQPDSTNPPRREPVCVRRLLCVSVGCNEQLGRCGLSQITPHSIILSDVANESAAVNRSNDLDSEFLRPSLRSCLYVCHPISLAIKHMFHVNLVMNKGKLTQLYSRCCSVGSEWMCTGQCLCERRYCFAV